MTTPPPFPQIAFTNPAATAEDVAYCFRLLLGRPPSGEEWTGHAGLIGMQLPAVVANYLGSEEFAARQRARASQGVQVTQLPGYTLYTSDHDLAVGHHVAAGTYEPHVATVFRRHLRPGMSVLDVGANIGVFTMLAASLVGPAGHVLAVEPNLANVRLLEASRRLNGFGHVKVMPCAAAAAPGMLLLRTAYSNGVTSPAEMLALTELQGAQLVLGMPLSTLVPPGRPLDFMKIDIEGAEHAALSAFATVLRRDRPVIVTEFSPQLLRENSGVGGAEYLQFLRSLGYGVAVIAPDGTALPLAADAAVLEHLAGTGGDHVDLLLTPA